ncbi:hypothetical protein ABKN59_000388 [Abortiporus biennis]
MFSLGLAFLASLSYAAAAPTTQLGFSNTTIADVKANLLQIATHSWELGTAAEALTELETPTLSVFSSKFPPPSNLAASVVSSAVDVLSIASTVVKEKPANSQTLIAGDGAVGDPASVGVSVLLANWTRTQLSDTSFSSAATTQLNYLLNIAPRSDDGAISHRSDQVQLWADFIYMAPPFIAYYGALIGGNDGETLLQTAYDQIRLYRQNLLDEDAGLWRHIALGQGTDPTHWATGNAWAAAGMLRVLETIKHSSASKKFISQQKDLLSWVDDILTSTWQHQRSDGGLYNVIDDSSTFLDTASTALMAAATFRWSILTNDLSHVSAANNAMSLIQSKVNSDGWLLDTVDPETFHAPLADGEHSPEGQAFVLLLQSAYRDYNSILGEFASVKSSVADAITNAAT